MDRQLATSVIKFADDPSKLKAVVPSLQGISGINRSLGDKVRSLALRVGVKTALPICFIKVNTVDIQFKFPQEGFVPIPLLSVQESEFLRANYQHVLLKKLKFRVVSLVPPGTPGKLGIGLFDTRMTTEVSSALANFEFAACKRTFEFTVEPNYYVSTAEDLSSLWGMIPKIIDVPIELNSFPFHVCIKPAFVATNELSCLPAIQNTIQVLTGDDVHAENRITDGYDMLSKSFSYGSDFAVAKQSQVGSRSMRYGNDALRRALTSQVPEKEIPDERPNFLVPDVIIPNPSEAQPRFEAGPVVPQVKYSGASVRR